MSKKSIDERTLLALRAGAKFGAWLFAWWSDGVEICGTSSRLPLREFYDQVDRGEYDERLTAGWLTGRQTGSPR